jgi:hypothetical protein
MEFGLIKGEKMINYKVNEAKFLADYLAIEESRSEKVLEAEKILVELGDRIKKLKPETVAQIKSDIYSDIDKEICEQKSFYDKYIIVEELCDNCRINVEELVSDSSANDLLIEPLAEEESMSIQIDDSLAYGAVQINTEPTDTIDIETTIIDTGDITANPTI